MIKPTVGRVVLYRPKDLGYSDEVRLAATIAKVIDDNTVNLGGVNEYGVPFAEQHVKLEHDPIVQPGPGECEWMPYQHGQAAKYDTGLDDVMERLARLEALLNEPQITVEPTTIDPSNAVGAVGIAADFPDVEAPEPLNYSEGQSEGPGKAVGE